ncbi:Mif2/CENP-C like-domain-containing protein [Lyophyllum atratum]|nr:Mif2/CENP-C like-domain-containing protein [Lyophyllum atratum]
MPTSATRKSSVGGARRGPQKAHIPYRGDNPEVGKKTGIAVQHVERKSDGFEPFEDVIQQADKRTPPKPKGRKRKQSVPVLDDELDEYGEMSMELDNSPLQYFANSRQPVTPISNRNGSSSRPVTRTSDIDFDQVPSPRSQGAARKSTGYSSGPGPSRLSNSFHAQDFERDSEEEDDDEGHRDARDYDDGPGEGDSPQGTSFMQMDQDDDDEEPEADHNGVPDDEEPEEETPPPSAKQRKGKGRAALPDVPEERESEVEDEIAKGLEDVHHQQYSDDDGHNGDDHPEPSPRRTKKAKFADERPKSQARPLGKSKKENRIYREGVRKSAREHYQPLEWWRGEKLVYGRTQRPGGGLVLVPPIREIVRIPKEEPEPLGKRKRPAARARSKSKVAEEIQYKIVPVENPEEGWDDETTPHCVILDFETRELVERRIAHTANMLEPKKVATDDWLFQKVFGDADFIAAGILIIPKDKRKPTKQTKDNTYIFYVVEGAINLKVHETSLVLATGAMFIVPRGNAYFIENICDRDAKLFFTQARKVVELPDEEANGSHIAPPRRSSTGVGKSGPNRSSSAGAMVKADGRAISKAPAPKRAASTR